MKTLPPSDTGVPLPPGCTLRVLPGSVPPDTATFAPVGMAVLFQERVVASAIVSSHANRRSTRCAEDLGWRSLRVASVMGFVVASDAPTGTAQSLWSALIRFASESLGAALAPGLHLAAGEAWEAARHAAPSVPLGRDMAWWAPTPKKLLFVCLRPTPSAAMLLARASEGLPEGRRFRPEDLHVTLGVIGPLDGLRESATRDAWTQVLDLATQVLPPVMRVSGVKSFSSGGRTMPCLVLSSDAVEEIRGMLGLRMMAEGMPLDTSHPFSPHMTVGRLEEGETGDAISPPCARFVSPGIWLCAGRRQAAAVFSVH